MAVTSNSAALFVLDCSYSMAQPRPFTQGSGNRASTTDLAPIDLAKTYIKSKIIQRILRDLKTTPVSLLCYAHRKSKNVLTQRQKDAAASGEGNPYVKEEDVYRNMYEQFRLEFEMDSELVHKVDQVKAGEGPDAWEKEEGEADFSADAHSALILALETLDAAPRIWTPSWKRDVYLITDGESESDWDSWESTRDRFEQKGVGLKVVGFNFDDEEVGYIEKDKSDIKRTNESYFHKITSHLSNTEPVTFSSAISLSSALASLSLPNVKSVKSAKTTMSLSIGNKETHPESFISMFVDVKKAVSAAGGLSMKRFSMEGYKRSARTGKETDKIVEEKRRESQAVGQGQSQGLREEFMSDAALPAPTPSIFATAQPASTFAPTSTSTTAPTPRSYEMGDIGRTLSRTLLEEGLAAPDSDEEKETSHAVTSDKVYRYRPLPEEYAAKIKAREMERKRRMEEKSKAAKEAGRSPPGSDEEEEDEAEEEVAMDEEEDMANWEAVLPEALSTVYEYGGEFVATEDMENGVGELTGLQTGLEINAFMKMKDVKFHHRLSDVYYILPVSSAPSSSLTFSSFINAMFERKSCAIVRFVGKSMKRNEVEKFPDPRMGIMWPVVEDTGVEYCWWVKMPFAEDIRQLDFPSLTTVTTAHGKVLTEHSNLPTLAQQEAMDAFVDDMDLSEAGGKDEDGNPLPWFSVADSYNPANHNINNTLVYRLSNPYGPLPPVPEVLVKYLDPPEKVVEKASGSLKRLREEMGVRLVPPRPKRTAKQVDNFSGAQEAAREIAANPDAEFDFVEHQLGFKAVQKSKGEALGLGVGGKGKGKAKEEGWSSGEAEKMDVDASEAEKEMDQNGDEVEEEQMKITPSPSQSKPSIKPSPSQSKPSIKLNPSQSQSKPSLPDISLLSDDSEPEPDTEDEDTSPAIPTRTTVSASSVVLDELNYLEEFVHVRDEKGVEVAVKSMVELVERLVEKSFSSQNYEKGVKALRRAREEARSSPSFYNTPLITLVASLRANPHKIDFISRIKEAGVGVIIGSKARGGMTEEEGEELLR